MFEKKSKKVCIFSSLSTQLYPLFPILPSMAEACLFEMDTCLNLVLLEMAVGVTLYLTEPKPNSPVSSLSYPQE